MTATTTTRPTGGAQTHAALDLGPGDAPEPQRVGQVPAHAAVRVQSVALEDHGEVALARFLVVDPLTGDLQVAAGDVLEAGGHPQQGRLAAARRAHQDEELALFDLEAELLDGLDVAEPLRDGPVANAGAQADLLTRRDTPAAAGMSASSSVKSPIT
jgi:hypothetical protein